MNSWTFKDERRLGWHVAFTMALTAVICVALAAAAVAATFFGWRCA